MLLVRVSASAEGRFDRVSSCLLSDSNGSAQAETITVEEAPSPHPVSADEEWTTQIDPAVLAALPESEVQRQTIIHKLISGEIQYLKDLDVIETVRFPMCLTDGTL